MYESFFGFREKPFSLLPDPSFIYLSKKHQEALTLLEYGLMNQAGFIVLTGEIGVGKTTLMRQLLGRLEGDLTVGLISNTHTSIAGLLGWICAALDIPVHSSNDLELHRALTDFLIAEYAKGKRTLLIIDEAQNLEPGHLEELRLLSNINSEKDLLLQLMLLGQPQLRDLLARPEHEQFVQRIAAAYHLTRLDPQETPTYIQHRLSKVGAWYEVFTAGACGAVHYYSNGVPRVINLICDTALVYAYGAQSRFVTEAIIDEVAESQSGQLLLRLEDPKARPRAATPAEPADPKRDEAPSSIRPASEPAGQAGASGGPPAPTSDPATRGAPPPSGQGAQGQEPRPRTAGAAGAAASTPSVWLSDDVSGQESRHQSPKLGRSARAVDIAEQTPSPARSETAPARPETSAVRAAPEPKRHGEAAARVDRGSARDAGATAGAFSNQPADASRSGRHASRLGLITAGILVVAMAVLLWLGISGPTHWWQSLVERAKSTLADQWGGGKEPFGGLLDAAAPGSGNDSSVPVGGGAEVTRAIQDSPTDPEAITPPGEGPTGSDDAPRARPARRAAAAAPAHQGPAPDLEVPAATPKPASETGDTDVNLGASDTGAEPEPPAAISEDRQRANDVGSALPGSSAGPAQLIEPPVTEVEYASGSGARSLDSNVASPPGARSAASADASSPATAVPRPESPASAPSGPAMRALEADLSDLATSVERLGSERLVADLGDHVAFSGGSVVLNREAQAFLRELAAALEPYQPLRLRVIGHTDLSGGTAVNQRLSERRAEAVAAFLVDNGLDSDQVSFEGRGEAEPKVALEQEWAVGPSVNRRIEIELTPIDEAASAPGD